MISPANLEKELFIVLIPGGEVKKQAGKIQELIADNFNIYDKMSRPELHVTIDRIKKTGIKTSINYIETIINKWDEKVNIALKSFNCFHQKDDRYLVLKIRPTKSLIKLSKRIHFGLSKLNLSTIQNYKEWRYHITIVNNALINKEITKYDFTKLCELIDGQEKDVISKVERIEIWQATVNNNEKIIYSKRLP
ncbi:MAG: 2'-5' RNA ligase family protein [Bacillota bacterium]